jgi:hypothetical protein
MERLAKALGCDPADFLAGERRRELDGGGRESVPILNFTEPDSPPRVPGDLDDLEAAPGESLYIPGIDVRHCFAFFVHDDAMDPPFTRGTLAVFTWFRAASDGEPCLVQTEGAGPVFRTVLAMPGGGWRLQSSNRRYEPIFVEAGQWIRMWPAIGRWQWA